MKNKLLVTALILSLILSSLSVYGLVPEEEVNLDYAQKLKKVGVFVGSDNGFELNRAATRLEGIVMLIRLLGEEEEALDTHYNIPFDDVPSWATEYVSYAYNYGLSNGISDTKFGSNDPLTNDQYFTFMARALGYDDSEGDFVWNQSIEFMKDIDFITAEEQDMYLAKELLRSDVAKLSYDLMTQPVKDSPLLLVNQLLQAGDLDPVIAEEIGIYTRIQTNREASATIASNPLIDTYDTININRSIEEGYPSPFSVPATTYTVSRPSDVITYTDGLTGQALFDSLSHKGFENLSIVYDKTNITWYDFFDEISINPTPSTLTIKLKNEDIFEQKYVDEYEQYLRYYTKASNVFYEVSELYMGDYTGDKSLLTKSQNGTMVYMHPFDENDEPTHNPLILSTTDKLLYVTFVDYKGDTVLYLEKMDNENLTKQWISLHEGIVLEEYNFDSDGVINTIKQETSISHEEIEDSVFVQPDIKYGDITMLIFSFFASFDTLQQGLAGTFSEEPFSFDMVADHGISYNIHVNGYDGGDEFDEFVYTSTRTDSQGNDVVLKQFYDGSLFHTIAPSMNIDDVFEGSVEQLMMFDFDSLSIRDLTTTGNIDVYTFKDRTYQGITGMPKYYEYRINTDTNIIESISEYFKDNFESGEKISQTIYTFENFGAYDATLLDIPSDIDVRERPGEVYYDGEHAMSWYYFNEFAE